MPEQALYRPHNELARHVVAHDSHCMPEMFLLCARTYKFLQFGIRQSRLTLVFPAAVFVGDVAFLV
jgi:hypothetical protein